MKPSHATLAAALSVLVLAHLNHPHLATGLARLAIAPAVSPPVLAANLALSLLFFSLAALYLGGIASLGSVAREWLAPGRAERRDWLVPTAAGLVIVSLLVLGLGLLGLLYRGVAAAVLGGAAAALGEAIETRRPRWRDLQPRWRRLAPGLLLLPVLPTLLAAPILPVTDIDMRICHLGLPSLWSLTHRIVAVPGIMTFSHPLGLERVVFPLVALGGERLLPAFSLVLLAAAGRAVALALGLTGSPHAGLGGWLVLGTGAALNLARLGHPDIGLVFAASLGMLAAVRGDRIGLGLACAAALLAKYTGAALVLSLVLAGLAFPLDRKPRTATALVVSALALVPNLPWLAHNALGTGNPVYPFGSALLPSLNWGKWNSDVLWSMMPSASVPLAWEPSAEAVRDLAGFFWRAATSPWFSPLLALVYLAPVALLARGTPPRLRWLAVLVAGFTVAWLLPEPKLGRYLLPVVPASLALLLAVAGCSVPRLVRTGLLLILLLEGLAFLGEAAPRPPYPAAVLAGAASREDYSTAHVGGFRSAAAWLNERPSGGRVTVVGNPAGHGLNRPWLAADRPNVPAFLLAAGRDADPERMRVRMRQRNVKWVMYNPVQATNWRHVQAGYGLTADWYRAYAEFWRRYARLARPAPRYDEFGAWEVYEILDAPRPRRERVAGPWLPGSELLQVNVLEIAGGRLDQDQMMTEEAIMGDFGVVWYHKMLASFAVRRDRKAAIREGEEAITRGLDLPWLYDTLAVLMLQEKRYPEAAEYARRSFELHPEGLHAANLLNEARKHVERAAALGNTRQPGE